MFALAETHAGARSGGVFTYVHAYACARPAAWPPDVRAHVLSVCSMHMSSLLDVVCAPHQAALGLLLSLLRNHPFCVSNQSCASRSPAKPLILGLLKSCFN